MSFAAKPHILVVDDDDRIRELLTRYLTGVGYMVMAASDAASARDVLATVEADLIVLDVMMPGMSGVDLTKTLRGDGNKVPILLLTAMGEVEDRIKGLEAGADDYLAKPFEPRELQLRIDAILRRTPDVVATMTRFGLGEWQIDLDAEELSSAGTDTQKLTPVEQKLLKALVAKAGEVIRRDDLARACGVNPDERTIDVQVTRLRRKLNDDPKQSRFIETVRGQGYQLKMDALRLSGQMGGQGRS